MGKKVRTYCFLECYQQIGGHELNKDLPLMDLGGMITDACALGDWLLAAKIFLVRASTSPTSRQTLKTESMEWLEDAGQQVRMGYVDSSDSIRCFFDDCNSSPLTSFSVNRTPKGQKSHLQIVRKIRRIEMSLSHLLKGFQKKNNYLDRLGLVILLTRINCSIL